MTDPATALREAQERRKRMALGDAAIELRVERALDIALAETGKPGTNFKQVTPAARKKLSALMRYYAKKPHPFTACVRDNTKRFGPERAKKVCAVLKDLIKGTTKWRKGGKKTHASEDDISLEELVFDDEVYDVLTSMTAVQIDAVAQALVVDEVV